MKKNITRVGVAMSMVGATLFGLATAAGAVVTDPTGGQFTTAIQSVQDWISTIGAGPLFALAAVGLLIGVALHYMRKGKSAASS